MALLLTALRTTGLLAQRRREDKIPIIDLRALRPRYFDGNVLPNRRHEAIVSMAAYVVIPNVQRAELLIPISSVQCALLLLSVYVGTTRR
ncbi:MAG: hypothetical protein ABEK75_09250, partial [Salinibacter sp.]